MLLSVLYPERMVAVLLVSLKSSPDRRVLRTFLGGGCGPVDTLSIARNSVADSGQHLGPSEWKKHKNPGDMQ